MTALQIRPWPTRDTATRPIWRSCLRIINFATGGLQPDLTLLLDVDIEIGLQRRSADSENWNRLDAKEVAFHQRVRAGYLEMAAAQPERFEIIDASQPLEGVLADIIKVVEGRLEK